MFLPGAYIVIHKVLVCNKFKDHKVLWFSCVYWSIIIEMGKVFKNRP